MQFPPLQGSFGLWLKRYREHILDMTQVAFAKGIGVSESSVQSYELDRVVPSREVAQKIAAYINYPRDEEFVLFARQGRAGRSSRSIPPRVPSREPVLDGRAMRPDISAEAWPILIEERFKNNDHRWGLGLKDDGTGILHRIMIDGAYMMTLIPRHHLGCFLSGDSAIIAPETFYFTVEVERIEGPFDGTGGIFFEALHDQQHILFHLRNEEQEFAVADLKLGGQAFTRVIPWQHRPDIIHPNGANKFGLLGQGERFVFYLNDVEVGSACLPRISGARLDLAIGGLQMNKRVVCLYRNALLRVPSDTKSV